MPRHLASRLWRWLRPQGQPLIGRLALADYIPSRPTRALAPIGASLFEPPAWSEPFWAVTIQTESGDYLHACLEPTGAPLRLGERVSLVARPGGAFSRGPVVCAILRPASRLSRG